MPWTRVIGWVCGGVQQTRLAQATYHQAERGLCPASRRPLFCLGESRKEYMFKQTASLPVYSVITHNTRRQHGSLRDAAVEHLQAR